MHLFQTIIDSYQNPSECIDFTAYDLSELSPVTSPNVSPARPRNRKLAMSANDVNKFLADAPEIIARNLAYWYQQGLQEGETIRLSTFQAIDRLAKITDTELAMAFLSLLIHASKYKLTTFKSFVVEIDSGLYRLANDNELPSKHVVDGALAILKTDSFVQVSTDILNAHLENESPVSTEYTKLQIQQCKILFVHFSYPFIRGWATANGVAINVRALNTTLYETLNHRVALACLLGHELQHFLNRYAFDNLNISTPEIIKANSSSPSAQRLKSKFPKNLESGLFFEYAAFGAKFIFKADSSKPLLNKMEERLSEMPVRLPLIREDEKNENFVKPFINPNLNFPFAFELSEEDEVVYE